MSGRILIFVTMFLGFICSGLDLRADMPEEISGRQISVEGYVLSGTGCPAVSFGNAGLTAGTATYNAHGTVKTHRHCTVSLFRSQDHHPSNSFSRGFLPHFLSSLHGSSRHIIFLEKLLI